MEDKIYFILINHSSSDRPEDEPSIKMYDFLKIAQEISDLITRQEAAK